MAYNVTAAIADIRIWIQDVDTTNPALADTQIIPIINHYYLRWFELYELPERTPTESAGGTTAASDPTPGTETINARVAKIVGVKIDNPGRPILFVNNSGYFSVVNRARVEAGASDEAGVLIVGRNDDSTNISVVFAPLSPDGVSWITLYVPYPSDLTAGVDRFLTSLGRARIVARIAAYECARILGRDLRMMQDILAEIPPEYLPMTAEENRPGVARRA